MHKPLYNFILTSFAVISLSSCSVGFGDVRRTDYAHRVEYETSMNWQQAFRVIKNNSIRCYQGNAGIIGAGATTTVNANLYNELGEAEIQINGNLGTFLLFEIIKLDEGAKIVGYSAMSTWTKELFYLKPVKSKNGEQFIFDC